jgi:hypothetical protein
MKQVIGVVLHQGGGVFRIEVRERATGFYGKWSCQECGAAGVSSQDFADADEAFTDAKATIARHSCGEHSSANN